MLHARRSRIKALLLDQGALRGMGNIYTDEALWRSRIHPTRLGANLKPEEIERLYGEVIAVLTEAIKMKGSSVSDYVDTDGNRGEFQTQASRLSAQRREVLPLRREDTAQHCSGTKRRISARTASGRREAHSLGRTRDKIEAW